MSSASRELGGTLTLAGPIIAGQVGQMLMAITDAAMIGRVGTVPLAASAFASALAHIPMVPALGLLAPVAVRIAQADGAGDGPECGREIRHGMVLATVGGLLAMLCVLAMLPFLGHFGQPEDVVAEAGPYLALTAFSMVPVLLFHGLKQYCEGLHKPAPAMWILLGGVLLNVVLNWILIYGNLGAPALGLTGAGIATLASRWVIVFWLWADIRRRAGLRTNFPTRWFGALERSRLKAQIQAGVPVAGQITFEVVAFSAAGLLMGRIGQVPLAAHQIALSCAAFTFMFPLGLSFATGVRIGAALGAGEFGRLRSIGRASLLASATVMLGFMGVFLLTGEWIAAQFVSSADALSSEVVALAGQLLVIAGIFQLFDGTQVVSIGALRGLNDVKVPTIATFVAYWVLALPMAWLLSQHTSLGARGVWIGLAIGLSAAAVLLVLRFERLAGQLAAGNPR